MHFYPFHIGDYRSSTAHLTNEEDLAYRRLIDMYYDTELPIPLETQRVARRLRVGSEVVSQVLHDFFEEREDGWHHPRCDEEIERYQALAERNRANGRLGGRPKTKGKNPVGSQSEPTGKATKNKEPGNKNQEVINTKALPRPDSVSEQVWKDFLAQRSKMKAPLTTTALAQMIRQAELADWTLEQAMQECILRGWRGFKAEWVNVSRPGQPTTKQPVSDWGTMEDL